MKKFFLLLIILVLPIWVYSQATQPVSETLSPAELQTDSSGPSESNRVIPLKPVLPMPDALTRVEGYMKEKNVDLSGQYIHSVQLSYDDGSKRKGHYWHVQWAWSTPRMGMEYGLRIYMDGTVLPDPTGP